MITKPCSLIKQFSHTLADWCLDIDFLTGLCRKSIMYTLWNFHLLSMLKALIQIGFQMSYVVSVTVFFLFCDLNTVHLLNYIFVEFHSLDMQHTASIFSSRYYSCSFLFVLVSHLYRTATKTRILVNAILYLQMTSSTGLL
jgi:hypothetical protein